MKAQASTLREWQRSWTFEEKPGASEVAMLMGRAAKLADAIAADEPIVIEEPPKPDEPVEQPREG